MNGGGIDASRTREPSSFSFITSFGILGALALPILRLLLLGCLPLCDCIRVEVSLGKTGQLIIRKNALAIERLSEAVQSFKCAIIRAPSEGIVAYRRFSRTVGHITVSVKLVQLDLFDPVLLLALELFC